MKNNITKIALKTVGVVAWLVILAVFTAPMGGCRSGAAAEGRASGDKAPTLEEMLSSKVPLPFDLNDEGNELSAEDRDDAAAAAAAANIAGGNGGHFKNGDPLLRAGLMVKASVMVGDKIEVPEMKLQISDVGDITMPMIGKIACDGLTLLELRSKLAEAYSLYYRQPDVTLEFIYDANSESPWGRILVMGRVKVEGWVNIPPTRNMTVSRAIQLAGGFSTSARKNKIVVTRRLDDTSQQQFRVNLQAVAEGALEGDLALLPGDAVYVPEKIY